MRFETKVAHEAVALSFKMYFGIQAAVEEGIVVGGGCTLLRLSSKVDSIKETLENDEEKVHIFCELVAPILVGAIPYQRFSRKVFCCLPTKVFWLIHRFLYYLMSFLKVQELHSKIIVYSEYLIETNSSKSLKGGIVLD